MKCSQLGGPNSCDHEFEAEAWEEMQKLSQKHGREMAENNDLSHLEAMKHMMHLMKDQQAMTDWMQEKKNLFDSN